MISDLAASQAQADHRPVVLVVEDEPWTNQAIRDALSSEFSTIGALNGEEALDLAHQNPPDLVLADMMMPGLAGDALLRAIRETKKLADVPVIFLTGRDDDGLRSRVLRGGAQDYILKPYSELELRARIHNVITQRRAAKVRAENAVLTEEVRVKTLLLRTLSHELRTPLNSILGFTQLVHDGLSGPISADQREQLGYALESGQALLRLVNNVLALVDIGASDFRLHAELLDLPALVDQVIPTVASQVSAKRLTLATVVEPTVGEVVSDPVRIRQVIYTFLSNAVRFTPEGGRIVIRFGDEGPGQFRLGVENSGPGILPQDLDRLFREVQQRYVVPAAAPSKTARLGLIVTKQIVEALGGIVGAESEPGMGSTFFAVLPRVAPAPAQAGSASAAGPGSAAGLASGSR